MKTRMILSLALLFVLVLAMPTLAQGPKDVEEVTYQPPRYPAAPLGTAETEPNDTAATADALSSPINEGDGGISPAGDTDWWMMGGASVDDLAFAYVDTSSSSTGADSQLNVYANDTTTLIEFDDDDGPSLSSVAAGAVVPQAGNVYFRINEFGDNGEITPYLLLVIMLDPSTDSAAETESNDSAATATPISAVMMTGAIVSTTAPDVDFYSFNALAGDNVAVILDDDPEDNGNLFDSELDILDTDGVTILAAGDDNSGNAGNAAGAVSIPADGTYYVRVQDGGFGGGDTTYRFVLHNPNALTAGFELRKDAVPPSARVGDSLTYTLRITNTGLLTLNAVVTDVLPQYVTTTHPLTWTPVITSPTGTWSQQLVVTVEPGCPGPIANVVRVTTDEGATGVYTTVTEFVNQPPIADAGEGQTVDEGSLVLLDGRSSTDPDGHLPLTYSWAQAGGVTVHIIGTDEPLAAFQAPTQTSVLTFTLNVTDTLGLGSSPDTMVVGVGAHLFTYLPLALRSW